MKSEMKIGFWGYPDPKIVLDIKQKYPNAEWIDLDIDFLHPSTNILPESYCKIIRNIMDNAVCLKPDIILAPIGKDKCDAGWFAAKILSDMGFNVIQTIYEKLEPKREVVICTSNLPLYEKITAITEGIVNPDLYDKAVAEVKKNEFSADSFGVSTNSKPKNAAEPVFGFWGVPPNDLSILKLFPDTTRVYGWVRCVEAGVPADLDLEMYVDEDIPTVFYAQSFCAKSQLAKYLADKYNGLYTDIDDYASNSIRAKIEAFLKLR